MSIMPKKTKQAKQAKPTVQVETLTIIAELEAKVAELTIKNVPSEVQKKKKTLSSYHTYLNNPEKYGIVKEVTYAELNALLSDGLTLDNMDSMLVAMNVRKWEAVCARLEAEIAELS